MWPYSVTANETQPSKHDRSPLALRLYFPPQPPRDPPRSPPLWHNKEHSVLPPSPPPPTPVAKQSIIQDSARGNGTQTYTTSVTGYTQARLSRRDKMCAACVRGSEGYYKPLSQRLTLSLSRRLKHDHTHVSTRACWLGNDKQTRTHLDLDGGKKQRPGPKQNIYVSGKSRHVVCVRACVRRALTFAA